jgi:hypothetical protein
MSRALSENARYAYQRLRDKGYPHHVAAGLVGNMMQESGLNLNTGAVGDNGNSFGAVQWNGPRRRAFMEYARQQGASPTDIGVQVDYLDHELNTSERGAREAIFAARDPGEAAMLASKEFWRPGDPRNENRARYARMVDAQLAGAAPAGLPQQQRQAGLAARAGAGRPAGRHGLSKEDLEILRRRQAGARLAGLPEPSAQDIVRLQPNDPTPEGMVRIGDTAVSGAYAGSSLMGLASQLFAGSEKKPTMLSTVHFS